MPYVVDGKRWEDSALYLIPTSARLQTGQQLYPLRSAVANSRIDPRPFLGMVDVDPYILLPSNGGEHDSASRLILGLCTWKQSSWDDRGLFFSDHRLQETWGYGTTCLESRRKNVIQAFVAGNFIYSHTPRQLQCPDYRRCAPKWRPRIPIISTA
jgi:hypothetical protein